MKAIVKQESSVSGIRRLTASQVSAVHRFQNLVLKRDQDDHTHHVNWELFFNGSFPESSLVIQAHVIEGKEDSYLHMTSLQDDNWFVIIGKRGGMIAKSCPKSYRQFDKGKAFGINFRLWDFAKAKE